LGAQRKKIMSLKNYKLQYLMAFALAAALMMIYTYAHAAAERSYDNLTSSDTNCSMVVEIEGQGSVSITRGNELDLRLDKAGTNQVAAQCGATVNLTAVANPLWQFVGWHVDGVSSNQAASSLQIQAPAQVTAIFMPREVHYLSLDEPIYDRGGQLVYSLPVYTSTWQSYAESGRPLAAASAPQFNIWYGSPQPFGLPGVPQVWMDVLGNVTDADNDLTELKYRLNDGVYRALNFGGNGSLADTRRLYEKGDFVIDLAVGDLRNGNNTVTIRATDSLGATTERQVIVNYTAGQTWPIPANVNWDRTGNLLDEAAVVDGQWGLQSNGDVRTLVTGYDRAIALGDISWTSYEAVVPITVNSYSDVGFIGSYYAPAVGVVMGWQGHTDSPIVCDQPKCGYGTLGMATWYDWDRPAPGQPPTGNAKFNMWITPSKKLTDESGLMLELGQRYFWKVQTNRTEGTYGTYRLKVWPIAEPEPAAWLLELAGTKASQAEGSLLLVAHHVDVSFGDIKVRPLDGDFAAPVISDVIIVPEETEAVLSWKTNEPSTGQVEYFSNPGDTQTAVSNTLSTNHQIVLDGLQPGTDYTVRITASDSSLNRSVPAEKTFKTTVVSQTYTLRVISEGYGTVKISPDKPKYESGTQISLFAQPLGPLWTFMNWSGDASGTANPLVVTITKDMVINAEFQKTANYLPYISGSD
jgi:hypothetical protein